jgi:hypothetical protein
MRKISKTFFSVEIWIPIFLGLIFFVITAPGTSWGAPDLWHPDELVRRVRAALEGELRFDTTNFDYPSLPKYVMYGIGKAVYGLGYSLKNFVVTARLFSVLLGSLIVGLLYKVTRLMGGDISTGILASVLLISNSQIATDARWAHNDLYVTFFVFLTVYFLIKYCLTEKKGWLLLSFFGVGLAASCKYNAGSLILTPALLYLYIERKRLVKNNLEVLQTFFNGAVLSIAGYAIGTPTSVLWLAFYVKRLLPALKHHAIYGREPGSVIGFLGQWNALGRALGQIVLIWTLLAVAYVIILLVRKFISTNELTGRQLALAAILMSILAIDLPIMISYNYQGRFFLPLFPMLFVIAAISAQDGFLYFRENGKQHINTAMVAAIALVIAASFLRVVSVYLLFKNDQRIPASAFLQTLPQGSRIEYTLYPPSINRQQFSNPHNYPLIFIKYEDFTLPSGRAYDYNVGEAGIEERKPDYLIIDSFTYERFNDPYICALHQTDCDFFTRLLAGETNYQLLETFSYSLPRFLPDLQVSFVNPILQVYQRKP